MAKITLQGKTIETIGELPQIGNTAPDFSVVKADLSEAKLKDYAGKRLIINVFPSIDTPTCATSVRKFNKAVNDLNNTAVLCVSADLPFAGARFCGAEGIENVDTGSTFRSSIFGQDYGVEITTGVLRGLLSRAIIVIDESGKIIHTEQVSEIGDEPDYDAALAVL
ncbi:thiol peroxidase [Desulfobacterales bacterium HSG17]|nr:thiol peroxidase [Desulfobacterales bacterium HSG17]